jgi:ABC-type Fe3+-hydroxamate transport system substrate-binding protein
MRHAITASLRPLTVLLAVALGTSACGNNSSTNGTVTTPTPTTPTATITDVFTGTVTVNGAKTHSFNANGAGTVTATLTTISPDSAVVIGFSVGTWNGTVCAVALANDQAAQGSSISGNTTTAGALCVRIYDVGNLTTSENYTITVAHP